MVRGILELDVIRLVGHQMGNTDFLVQDAYL